MKKEVKKSEVKKGRGIFAETRTAYNFVDRDPIFGIVQSAVAESGMSYAEITEAGGASITTVRNYMKGGTRTGRFDCLMRTIRAAGGDLEAILPSGKKVKLGGK